MAFSNLIDRLSGAVVSHLADADGTWISPDGDVATFAVLIDRDVERAVGGMQSGMTERRTEMTAPSNALVEAKRGDVVTVGDQEWQLVSKVGDDGQLVTWIVKEGR